MSVMSDRRARFKALHHAEQLFVMPNPCSTALGPPPRLE
jgi:2-methylisocitrate lyase-like PEP mutase family enzyme